MANPYDDRDRWQNRDDEYRNRDWWDNQDYRRGSSSDREDYWYPGYGNRGSMSGYGSSGFRGSSGSGYDQGSGSYGSNYGGYNRGFGGNYGRSGYNRSGFNSGSSGSSYDQGWDRSANQGDYNRRTGQNWEASSDWDEEPVWAYSEYWWVVPGPYSGVGPRQYQRSDDRICDDVCERMAQHGQLDASQIDVEVNNGEATLTGTVNSRREKRLAEDIVESVFGVSDVHNQLRISGQSGQSIGQSDRGQNIGQQRMDRPSGQQRSGQSSGQLMESGMQGRSSPQENNMQTTLPSSGSLRSRIREGMEVVGLQGRHIGQVKEIRQNDFLVDREMARDVYVPFSALQSTEGRVMLNVRADEVDNQGWEMSEIMGSSSQGQTGR